MSVPSDAVEQSTSDSALRRTLRRRPRRRSAPGRPQDPVPARSTDTDSVKPEPLTVCFRAGRSPRGGAAGCRTRNRRRWHPAIAAEQQRRRVDVRDPGPAVQLSTARTSLAVTGMLEPFVIDGMPTIVHGRPRLHRLGGASVLEDLLISGQQDGFQSPSLRHQDAITTSQRAPRAAPPRHVVLWAEAPASWRLVLVTLQKPDDLVLECAVCCRMLLLSDFRPPSPGIWELEATHTVRPFSRAYGAVVPAPSTAGFRESTRRYGLLLDTMEFAAINSYMYVCVRAVGAPKVPKGPPPKALFTIMTKVHPEIRRRNRTITEVFAQQVMAQ